MFDLKNLKWRKVSHKFQANYYKFKLYKLRVSVKNIPAGESFLNYNAELFFYFFIIYLILILLDGNNNNNSNNNPVRISNTAAVKSLDFVGQYLAS
jgi:hypothetical protein